MPASVAEKQLTKWYHYLRLHEAHPQAYPLSQSAVADFADESLGLTACSRQTLMNHGIDKLIKAAKSASHHPPVNAGRRTKQTTRRDEAKVWQTRYEAVLRKLRLIEYHLRGRPDVDLDAIYAHEMPKPDRSQPKSGRRGFRRGEHHSVGRR